MELLGAILRGLIILIGNLVALIDPYELFSGRRRRKRLAALEQGEPVDIPCVLRDPDLTGGEQQVGLLSVGGRSVTWRAKGKGQAEPVVFAPGPLTVASADEKELAFRSEDGKTELRLHPDEALYVLKAISQPDD